MDAEQRENERREEAIKRLRARRDFGTHLAAYIVVNGFLVVIWAFTGQGYFWPIWPMAGWAIGLLLNAWDVFLKKPISEEEIQREMRRGT